MIGKLVSNIRWD